MKNNPIATTLLLLILGLIGAQIHFDFAERTFVRQIAAAHITAAKILAGDEKGNPGLMQETAAMKSMLITEFPDKVKDYNSKVEVVKK